MEITVDKEKKMVVIRQVPPYQRDAVKATGATFDGMLWIAPLEKLTAFKQLQAELNSLGTTVAGPMMPPVVKLPAAITVAPIVETPTAALTDLKGVEVRPGMTLRLEKPQDTLLRVDSIIERNPTGSVKVMGYSSLWNQMQTKVEINLTSGTFEILADDVAALPIVHTDDYAKDYEWGSQPLSLRQYPSLEVAQRIHAPADLRYYEWEDRPFRRDEIPDLELNDNLKAMDTQIAADAEVQALDDAFDDIAKLMGWRSRNTELLPDTIQIAMSSTDGKPIMRETAARRYGDQIAVNAGQIIGHYRVTHIASGQSICEVDQPFNAVDELARSLQPIDFDAWMRVGFTPGHAVPKQAKELVNRWKAKHEGVVDTGAKFDAFDPPYLYPLFVGYTSIGGERKSRYTTPAVCRTCGCQYDHVYLDPPHPALPMLTRWLNDAEDCPVCAKIKVHQREQGCDQHENPLLVTTPNEPHLAENAAVAPKSAPAVPVYRYLCTHRPPTEDYIPPGAIDIRHERTDRGFGCVTYAAPISARDAYRYDLFIDDPLPSMPVYPVGAQVRNMNTGKVYPVELHDGEYWIGDEIVSSVRDFHIFEPIEQPAAASVDDRFPDTITIQYEVNAVKDQISCSAKIIGQFAVHETLKEPTFTVTHVKSGLGIRVNIPTYEAAVALVGRLSYIDVDAWYEAGSPSESLIPSAITHAVKIWADEYQGVLNRTAA